MFKRIYFPAFFMLLLAGQSLTAQQAADTACYRKYIDRGKYAISVNNYKDAIGYFKAAAECREINAQRKLEADSLARDAASVFDSILVISWAYQIAGDAITLSRENPTQAVRLVHEACKITRNRTRFAVDIRRNLIEDPNLTFYSNELDCDCVISGLAATRDNQSIAIGCQKSGTVKIYNLKTRELITLGSHSGDNSRSTKQTDVLYLSFSNKGDKLLSGAKDGTVCLWQKVNNEWQIKKRYVSFPDLRAVAFYVGDETMLIASGRKVTVRSTADSRTILHSFDDMPADILSMAYSSDGKIACALSNFVIRVWPSTDQNQYYDLKGHTERVLSVQFSRNSHLLVSGAADNKAILWDAETGALIRTFDRHTGEVRSASFFADDDKIVTAGNDHYVYLWDRNGVLLQTLLCAPTFNGLALATPDRKHIVTGDQNLRFWPVNWSVFNTNTPHIAEITSMALAPGDELCLTGSKDHTAKIWNIENQDVVWTFHAEDEVVAVDWSLNGNYFMVGLRNGTVHLFDSDRLLIGTFKGQHSSSLTCLAMAPDGKHYVSGSRDGLAKVWELNGTNNPLLLNTLTDRSDIASVAWSPNGLMIAVGFLNENVKIYPWDKPKPLNSRPIALRDSVNCLRFSPDNKSLLACGSYGAAQMFTLKGHTVQSFDLTSDNVSVTACDFSSYGNRIALATRVGKTKIMTLNNNKWTQKVYKKALPGKITCVRWLKSRGQLLVAGEDGRIRLFDEDMTQLKVYRGHTGDIQFGVMAAKKTFFITAGTDQTIKLWTKNNRELISHPVKGPITAIALHSPNGKTILTGVTENKKGKLYRFTFGKTEVTDTLIYTFPGNIQAISSYFKGDSSRYAACDNRGNIKVFDRSYHILREKQIKNPLTTLTFSPKSGLLAIGTTSTRFDIGLDNSLYLWDWQKDKITDTLPHLWAIRSVAFSADEQLLATGDDHGTITFWQTQTGELIKKYEGQDTIRSLCFSPNGKYLLSTDVRGSTLVWDASDDMGAIYSLMTLALPNDQIISSNFASDDTIIVFGKRTGAAFIPNRLGQLDRNDAAIAPLDFDLRLEHNINPDIRECLSAQDPETVRECARFYITSYLKLDDDPQAFNKADSMYSKIGMEQSHDRSLMEDYYFLYARKGSELTDAKRYNDLIYIRERQASVAQQLIRIDSTSSKYRTYLIEAYWSQSWYLILTGQYAKALSVAKTGLAVPGGNSEQEGIMTNVLLAQLLLANNETEFAEVKKSYESYASKPWINREDRFGDVFATDFKDFLAANPNLPKDQKLKIERIRSEVLNK